MIEQSAIAYAVYRAAEEAGFRWNDPRGSDQGGMRSFSALLVPPDHDEDDAVTFEVHTHEDGQSCLLLTVPLLSGENESGLHVGARAQQRLREELPEDRPVDAVFKGRLRADGIPVLDDVWLEVHHDVTDEMEGRRELDADAVVADLARKLRVLEEASLFGSAHSSDTDDPAD